MTEERERQLRKLYEEGKRAEALETAFNSYLDNIGNRTIKELSTANISNDKLMESHCVLVVVNQLKTELQSVIATGRNAGKDLSYESV